MNKSAPSLRTTMRETVISAFNQCVCVFLRAQSPSEVVEGRHLVRRALSSRAALTATSSSQHVRQLQSESHKLHHLVDQIIHPDPTVVAEEHDHDCQVLAALGPLRPVHSDSDSSFGEHRDDGTAPEEVTTSDEPAKDGGDSAEASNRGGHGSERVLAAVGEPAPGEETMRRNRKHRSPMVPHNVRNQSQERDLIGHENPDRIRETEVVTTINCRISARMGRLLARLKGTIWIRKYWQPGVTHARNHRRLA
jgi:hypothetical protein